MSLITCTFLNLSFPQIPHSPVQLHCLSHLFTVTFISYCYYPYTPSLLYIIYAFSCIFYLVILQSTCILYFSILLFFIRLIHFGPLLCFFNTSPLAISNLLSYITIIISFLSLFLLKKAVKLFIATFLNVLYLTVFFALCITFFCFFTFLHVLTPCNLLPLLSLLSCFSCSETSLCFLYSLYFIIFFTVTVTLMLMLLLYIFLRTSLRNFAFLILLWFVSQIFSSFPLTVVPVLSNFTQQP